MIVAKVIDNQMRILEGIIKLLQFIVSIKGQSIERFKLEEDANESLQDMSNPNIKSALFIRQTILNYVKLGQLVL